MNQVAQETSAEMPDLTYPRIVLMAADNIDGTNVPLTWGVGFANPLAPDMKVIAMFIDDSVVEVYSSNGKAGVRELVPLHRVRLIRESMPFDIFNEELGNAELGEDEDPEEEEGGDSSTDQEAPQPRDPSAAP